jgi:N-acetyl-alpha-D-glucosaminyl L-malate synthase BshA
MNIGIVCYPTYGGSGVVATELGKSLADNGHGVHFISYQQPARLDSFHSNIFFHEVRFSDYPLFHYSPYESALASKIVDVAKFEDLDVLHVHYAIPHAATAFMAKQILREEGIELPVVTTLHGTDITLVGKDITYSPVVTFSINQSDGVTAVSQDLKQDTYEHFKIRKEIEVIPNFVDFTRFNKTDKDHFKKAIASQDEKIIAHISNFRKVKRVRDVLITFSKIHNKVPSKLLMIGDGPERQGLEQLCRELGTCDEVLFLGKQEAVEELLAVSDLFMLPSESESFGLAALEAMACHVPVISSNAGGIPEINIHGKTGYVSEVGDVEDMAANALKLLMDQSLLNEFRENAYKHARNYDVDKIMPKYLEFYESVIEKSKAQVIG